MGIRQAADEGVEHCGERRALFSHEMPVSADLRVGADRAGLPGGHVVSASYPRECGANYSGAFDWGAGGGGIAFCAESFAAGGEQGPLNFSNVILMER